MAVLFITPGKPPTRKKNKGVENFNFQLGLSNTLLLQ